MERERERENAKTEKNVNTSLSIKMKYVFVACLNRELRLSMKKCFLFRIDYLLFTSY